MTSTLVFALTLCILAAHALSYRPYPNHYPSRCGPNEKRVPCIDRCQTCKYRYGGCVQPQVCTPGCNCIDGFYRNKQGKCVPEASCDAERRCRPDEEYQVCACDKNCCNKDNPEACRKECLTGCFCRTGLVRDKQGNCIRPENCPSNEQPPVCGVNEEYSECGSACTPTCDDRNPEVCTDQCVRGCFCKNGFIREKKGGRCIPKSQCPPETCGPNEVYSDCVNPCNDCQSRNVTCNFLVCNKGCDCRPGYTRNDRRICIPESQCPPGSHTCGRFSHLSYCASQCPPTCSIPDPICIQSCKVGCECDPGYILLDDSEICIAKHLCPKPIVCGPNSKLSSCVFCPATCRNPKPTACPESCGRGCACDPGFIKDDNGNCIPPDQCPAVCGPNSKPSDCVFCEPTCRNPKPEVCAQSCTKGCACDPGYIKDDNGNCIPEYECPAICGPNSTPSSCVFCEPTCRNPKPKVCAQSCTKGCACDPGFIKDDKGNCIPQDHCPVSCGPNSTPSDCASNCPRTCNSDQEQKVCPAVCIKGCICNPGYIDDGSGNCIPEDECPPNNNGFCSKPGEIYKSCGSPCIATCTNLRFHIYIKCPKRCKPGCFCRDGLVRDSNNNCVEPSQCPNNGFCSKPGEVYKSCGSPCEATCANRRFNILIKCPKKCKPGCFCKDGLVRDSDNNCVDPDQCPNSPQCSMPKCGPGCRIDYNTKPCPCCKCEGATTAGSNCGLTVTGPGSVNCTTTNGVTQCDIYCDGRYQGRFTCSGRGWSPPLPPCAKSSSNSPQCSMPKCGPGCQIDYNSKPCPSCKCEGATTAGGNCDLTVTGQGSVNCTTINGVTQCDIYCDGRYQGRFTCSGRGWTPTLPPCAKSGNNSPQCSMPKCGPGCRTDYTSKPCPSCKCEGATTAGGNCGLTVTGPGSVNCTTINGVTQCDIYCDGRYQGRFTCSGRGWSPPLPPCAKSSNNSPQCSMPKCGSGCQIDYNSKPCASCKCEGSGTAGSNCNLTVKGPGSVNCTTTSRGTVCDIYCDGKYQGKFTCSGRGWTPALPSCATSNSPRCSMPNCKPGCQIDYNSKPCPRCKCEGPGTGPQCSIPKCGPDCEIDYSSKPCPSCKCEGSGPNEFCSKPGEIYKSCGSPCEATCRGLLFHELILCPEKCKPGCFCRDDLVRDSNNNCIEPSQCPKTFCGVNEERLECGSACPPTCDNRNPGVCTLQCVNGCFCKNGFIREKKGGSCIPESQCPSVTGGDQCDLTVTGPDSSFNCTKDYNCTQCDIYCDGNYRGQYSCCDGQGWEPPLPSCAESTNPNCPVSLCPRGCRYARVPNKPCPICICDQNNNGTCERNEVFSECGTACQPTCAKRSRPCTKQCARGCFCKKGYIRQKEGGKCIPTIKCPKGPICHLPLCRVGCKIVKVPNQPCPKCVCNSTGPTCSLVVCKAGCQLIQNPNGGCAKCVCDKNTTTTGGSCDLVVTGSGSFNCITGPNGTQCGIFCDGKYKGQFTCSPGQGWKPALPRCVKPKRPVICNIPLCKSGCKIVKDPNEPCPKCVCDTNTNSGGECNLTVTGPDSSFDCETDTDGTRCDIYCDGEYEGEFVCSPGRGWEPPLPPCAKSNQKTCPQIRCRSECPLNEKAKPCPRCECKKPPTGPVCSIPACKVGCQIVPDPNGGCPKCVCDKNTTSPVCSIPLCKVGCQIVQNPNGGCAKCVCDKNTTTAGGSCDLVITGPGSFNCITGPNSTRCCIFCDGMYKGQFTCSPGQGWTPALPRCVKPKRPVICNTPFCPYGCPLVKDPNEPCPKCVCNEYTTGGGECNLTVTGPDSSFDCKTDTDGTRCDIYCDGEYEGEFVCSPGQGWEPPLPPCAKSNQKTCPQIRCRAECPLNEKAKPCPRCECKKPPKDTCKKNEEPLDCGSACPPTCSNRNPVCTEQCVKGCFCKEGFIRKCKNGACIPESQCPAKDNDYYEDYEYEKDEEIEEEEEEEEVEEEEEYDYDYTEESGETSNNECGKNEVIVKCAKPKSCNTCLIKGNCKLKSCSKGCDCKKGYYRNGDGICMPQSQCSKCGKDEAIFSCAKPKWCNTCGIRGNCKLTSCKEGCDCIRGFYRNDEGICIPESQCPGNSCPLIKCPADCAVVKDANSCPKCECEKSPSGCGKNEVIVKCAKPKWCNTCGIKGRCKLKSCPKGCDCKKGYYRNGDGICMPESQCSKCGKDEAIFSCAKPKWCNTCAIRGNCKLTSCKEGCDCIRGFYRNDEGICIRASECPGNSCPLIKCPADCAVVKDANSCPKCECEKSPSDTCKPDEQEYQCKPFCANRCHPLKVCPKICIKGCFCKEGLVLNDDGKCVRKDQCNQTPPDDKNCTKNEQYYPCKPTCNNTCENYGKKGPCPFICAKGCFCKKGLVLRKDGECVKPEKCKKDACGPDEQYYRCKPFCANRCNPITKCPKICIKGCFCKKGLVLNDEGKCVKKDQCNQKPPDDKNCKKNEQYYSCKPTCNNTCENYGKKVACPLYCQSGCYCKKGLVLRKDGECVKPEKCEEDTCGPDEQYYQCKPFCINRCNPPKFCPRICIKGCFCKKGLVLNDDGKCVKKDQCSQKPPDDEKCKKNEQYYSCKPTCNNTCENYGRKGPCPLYCMKGCFCKTGLVLRKDGECVKPEKCKKDETCPQIRCTPDCPLNEKAKPCPKCECKKPPTDKCGKNEVHLDCGSACPPTCEDKDPKVCTMQCVEGCFCKKYFIREKKGGRCIPQWLCPSGKCGKNEERQKCGTACPPTCANRNPFCTKQCIDGCSCKKGFIRDKEGGKCIPESQCPSDTCGENEEHQECGTACPSTCANRDPVCTRQCKTGCFCKKGFIRKEEGGKCIPESQCPKECPLINCLQGCDLDREHKPCPRCVCPKVPVCPRIACRPPCHFDNSKPCPKCICDNTGKNINGYSSVEVEESEENYEKYEKESYEESEEESYEENGGKSDEENEEEFEEESEEEDISEESDLYLEEDSVEQDTTEMSASSDCAENEKPDDCGTACQPTCANKSPNCTKQCVKGCFCEKGYIRAQEGGKCILEKQCPNGGSSKMD